MSRYLRNLAQNKGHISNTALILTTFYNKSFIVLAQIFLYFWYKKLGYILFLCDFMRPKMRANLQKSCQNQPCLIYIYNS